MHRVTELIDESRSFLRRRTPKRASVLKKSFRPYLPWPVSYVGVCSLSWYLMMKQYYFSTDQQTFLPASLDAANSLDGTYGSASMNVSSFPRLSILRSGSPGWEFCLPG